MNLLIFQVVGLNVDLSCATMFVVCVFYTSVGGMKAVVWTDVFQVGWRRKIITLSFLF